MRNKRKDEKNTLLENIAFCGMMTCATLLWVSKFIKDFKNKDEDKKE